MHLERIPAPLPARLLLLGVLARTPVPAAGCPRSVTVDIAGFSGGAPEGIDRLGLKEGDGTKAHIAVKARGPLLATPTLPLVLPVTVQLHANDSPSAECWEATFVESKKNDGTKFKARGQ